MLYNIVLVLPHINMNPPWVYTCSPSWTPLLPPSLYYLLIIFGKVTKILKGSLNSLLFLKTSHHVSGFRLLTSLPNTVPNWSFHILCPSTALVPLSHLFSRPFQFCLCTHYHIQHINRPLTKNRKHKTLIRRERMGQSVIVL